MYFRYFVINSPWKRSGPVIWTNLNPLHPRMLFAKFDWNWPSGSGEEDYLILSMCFRYFVIISPWKRAGPFIWTNFNPLHPKMLCAKFWSSGSGEEDENVKSLQTDGHTDGQTDRQTTDDRWSEKLTWAFSSGELKSEQTHALPFVGDGVVQREFNCISCKPCRIYWNALISFNKHKIMKHDIRYLNLWTYHSWQILFN